MNRAIDTVVEVDGALILGAGIAGLFTALKLAPYPCLVLAGSEPGTSGSSAWAQGGIAAAVGEDDDWSAHAHDTIAAGAGLCDPTIVEMVAREAPARIDDLLAHGVGFDRAGDGTLALGREAAHGKARIVHVSGDRAGAEISRVLGQRALAAPSIGIRHGIHAVELAMEDGMVAGLFARCGTGAEARLIFFRSRHVVFATGGLGALYAVTTNPLEARGEGLGMAARAGALIADAEFMQFHPTAIAAGRDPAPLATEALRGEGATLINEQGKRFMPAIHADGELAPRDVVARAIHRQIAAGHRAFLDCRTAIGADFARRFPTVHAACVAAGIDPVTQPIPVAPAAHYHMGGIASDARGRSSLPGLWVAGECAATGLHGANRLASNSLLEGMVFGARVADDIKGVLTSPKRIPVLPPLSSALPTVAAPSHVLRDTMNRHVGLEREENGLRHALDVIGRLERAAEPALLNMLTAARLVTASALAREESRGAHWRSDHPASTKQAARTFLTLEDAVTQDETAEPRRAHL